jgi:hypothetical protein
MLPVQSARIPFLTKKRSFDLAWGAWAGILAVMIAVGAAMAGSQILLMYPRTTSLMVFKHPSLPVGDVPPSLQFGSETVAIYFGEKGVLMGFLNDISAAQASGRLFVSRKPKFETPRLTSEFEQWAAKSLKRVVSTVAIGESVRRQERLSIGQYAEIVAMIEQVNKKLFGSSVKPAIVPVELVNPI